MNGRTECKARDEEGENIPAFICTMLSMDRRMIWSRSLNRPSAQPWSRHGPVSSNGLSLSGVVMMRERYGDMADEKDTVYAGR